MAWGSRGTLQSQAGRQLTAPPVGSHAQPTPWAPQTRKMVPAGQWRETPQSRAREGEFGPGSWGTEKQQPGKPRGRRARNGQGGWHGGRSTGLIQMRSARDKTPSAVGRSISTGGNSPRAHCLFLRVLIRPEFIRKPPAAPRSLPGVNPAHGAGGARVGAEPRSRSLREPSPERAAPGAPVRRLPDGKCLAYLHPCGFRHDAPPPERAGGQGEPAHAGEGEAGEAPRRLPQHGGAARGGGAAAPEGRTDGASRSPCSAPEPGGTSGLHRRRAHGKPGGTRTTGGSAPAGHGRTTVTAGAGSGPPPAGPSAAQPRTRGEARSSRRPRPAAGTRIP